MMKVAKWVMAVMALIVFVGCQKSDEQKLQDASKQLQKDAGNAVEDVKVPSLK